MSTEIIVKKFHINLDNLEMFNIFNNEEFTLINDQMKHFCTILAPNDFYGQGSYAGSALRDLFLVIAFYTKWNNIPSTKECDELIAKALEE